MDHVLLSATIFTGNPQNPWAEAIAIEDNRIKAVGRNAAIKLSPGCNGFQTQSCKKITI